MKSIFRDILLENEFSLPLAYLPREQPFSVLPRKALAVIGIRRCGKTTYLRQIWDTLLRQKKGRPDQLLYVNFFDERLFGLRVSQLRELLDAYYELHPQMDARATLSFFLDEIQTVPGWELFVDRLLRAGHQVFLSGSSSTLLSRELASAMRGRSLSIELFPFGFKEILKSEKQEWRHPGPRDRAVMRARFRTYLQQGGFPETLDVSPPVRRRLLQDYVDTVLLRDIIERHNPSDPSAMTHLSHLLMNQAGALYTLNKTCERLKAQGLKVNKPEISQALDWFHDSYLYFSVPILSQSVQAQVVNPKKIYCIDTGMVFHHSVGLSDQWGVLLENAVFLHLRRRAESIFYYKDSHQREVDFVVPGKGRSHTLIQVSVSIKSPKTRERETQALLSAMADLSIPEATLITLDEEEEIRTAGKRIHVRPAWSFLLE
jgi:predicted AAA+ superfamily ATPase